MSEPVGGVNEGKICLELAAAPANLLTGCRDDPARAAEAVAEDDLGRDPPRRAAGS